MSSISTLETVRLADILPASISDEEQLAAVAGALDAETRKIIASIKTFLPYLPNLANQCSRIVDLLAWQYHVDDYNVSADLATRCAKVRSAIADHKLYGTRAAVVKAVDAYIGAGKYTLLEWWETVSKGHAYTYRIKFHALPPGFDYNAALPFNLIPAAAMTRLASILAIVSNVRSKLVGYLFWDEVDALQKDWDSLEAIGLTWDQMDAYCMHVVV